MSSPKQPSESHSDTQIEVSAAANDDGERPIARPQIAARRELRNLHAVYRRNSENVTPSVEPQVDLARSSRAGRRSVTQNPNIYNERRKRSKKDNQTQEMIDPTMDDEEPFDTSLVNQQPTQTPVFTPSLYGASRNSFFSGDVSQTTDPALDEVEGFFHAESSLDQPAPSSQIYDLDISTKGEDRQIPVPDLVASPNKVINHKEKRGTPGRKRRRIERSTPEPPILSIIAEKGTIEEEDGGSGSELTTPESSVVDDVEGGAVVVNKTEIHEQGAESCDTPQKPSTRGRGRGRGRGRPRGRAGTVRMEDGLSRSGSRAGSAMVESGRGRKRKRNGELVFEERRSLPRRTVQLSKSDIGQKIRERNKEIAQLELEIQALTAGTHPKLADIYTVMDKDYARKKRSLMAEFSQQEKWLQEQLACKQRAIWNDWRCNTRELLESTRRRAERMKLVARVEMEGLDTLDASRARFRSDAFYTRSIDGSVVNALNLPKRSILGATSSSQQVDADASWALSPEEIDHDLEIMRIALQDKRVQNGNSNMTQFSTRQEYEGENNRRLSRKRSNQNRVQSQSDYQSQPTYASLPPPSPPFVPGLGSQAPVAVAAPPPSYHSSPFVNHMIVNNPPTLTFPAVPLISSFDAPQPRSSILPSFVLSSPPNATITPKQETLSPSYMPNHHRGDFDRKPTIDSHPFSARLAQTKTESSDELIAVKSARMEGEKSISGETEDDVLRIKRF